MDVKDKRVAREAGVPFGDLSIGQVYEDRDGVLCIKTENSPYSNNCICFNAEGWECNHENLTQRVIPLTATLEIEG